MDTEPTRPDYFGRRALYAPEDLIAWAQARTSTPRKHTSEGRANAA